MSWREGEEEVSDQEEHKILNEQNIASKKDTEEAVPFITKVLALLGYIFIFGGVLGVMSATDMHLSNRQLINSIPELVSFSAMLVVISMGAIMIAFSKIVLFLSRIEYNTRNRD